MNVIQLYAYNYKYKKSLIKVKKQRKESITIIPKVKLSLDVKQ